MKLSFFAVPGVLAPINSPLTVEENALRVASLIDLAAMKVKVVQSRAEAKDYIDIDAILQTGDITLGEALRAAEMVYGQSFAVTPSVEGTCVLQRREPANTRSGCSKPAQRSGAKREPYEAAEPFTESA